MKVVFVGKGGSGKTTASAIAARTMAAAGVPVIALDCDSNPNLAISLGMGEEVAEHQESIRQSVEAAGRMHLHTWDELIGHYATEGPDGIRLAVVSRIEATPT